MFNIIGQGRALFIDEMEQNYKEMLAPFAVITGNRNDMSEELTDDNRTMFQRDRDRIIHSSAFRRLMYKTQVFVNHEGDQFRTRLTHTLEVSQLARGVCKSLGLNEDLAEAIALGHDLGHTPFGHVVESLFGKEFKNREMGDFFHNEQSVRIVDFLEKRKEDKKGLNLTNEVREGILKHNKDRSGAFEDLNPKQECSHLEGQIVAVVDTIAYICHDLEDAIKAGIIFKNERENPDFRDKIEKIVEATEKVTGENSGKPIKLKFALYDDTYFIRDLIHFLILDLTENTFKKIIDNKITTLEDVKKLSCENKAMVVFSKEVLNFFKNLKDFVYKNIYRSQTVALMDDKAEVVIREMFNKLIAKPILLPADWFYNYKNIDRSCDEKTLKNNEIRVICDYLASMTDRFALDVHKKMFDPRVRI